LTLKCKKPYTHPLFIEKERRSEEKRPTIVRNIPIHQM